MTVKQRILIICPTCKKSKRILAPADIITQKETGSTSVYIPPTLVCEHEFYAYIDKNFAVRDYLVLEFSLQDEAKKTEKIKRDIMEKIDEFDMSWENLLNFITEKDLRSLLYACYIESPLLLIENEPTQERFGIIFNYLVKLYPDIAETCNIFTPELYLEYSENQKERIQNHTVFNVIYKLSVSKPFLDSDAEAFDQLMELVKKPPFKIQSIYAKNFIDYLRKFSDDIAEMDYEKIEKVQKFLKKEDSKHSNMYSSDLIGVMRRRKLFKKFWKRVSVGKQKKEKMKKNFNSFWEKAFSDTPPPPE